MARSGCWLSGAPPLLCGPKDLVSVKSGHFYISFICAYLNRSPFLVRVLGHVRLESGREQNIASVFVFVFVYLSQPASSTAAVCPYFPFFFFFRNRTLLRLTKPNQTTPHTPLDVSCHVSVVHALTGERGEEIAFKTHCST